MEEQIVSFETAKLAKQMGFNEWCYYYYDFNGKIDSNNSSITTNAKYCSAPTQSLLEKWLREKHNLFISVWFNDLTGKWWVDIYELPTMKIFYDSEIEFKTYEEALERGLQEALK